MKKKVEYRPDLRDIGRGGIEEGLAGKIDCPAPEAEGNVRAKGGERNRGQARVCARAMRRKGAACPAPVGWDDMDQGTRARTSRKVGEEEETQPRRRGVGERNPEKTKTGSVGRPIARDR